MVSNRSTSTIVEVLSRHVIEGSTILTDCWKGYASLDKIFNIVHETVNHKKWFKDPHTGTHTNTVEGTNYALKRHVPPRNRTEDDLPGFLHEFVWRRKNRHRLWEAFLDALRNVVYLTLY